MNQKDKLMWRKVIVTNLARSRFKAEVFHDFRPFSWAAVARQLDIDPSRLSKYVTGVTDVPAYMFLAILDVMGVLPKDFKL